VWTSIVRLLACPNDLSWNSSSATTQAKIVIRSWTSPYLYGLGFNTIVSDCHSSSRTCFRFFYRTTVLFQLFLSKLPYLSLFRRTYTVGSATSYTIQSSRLFQWKFYDIKIYDIPLVLHVGEWGQFHYSNSNNLANQLGIHLILAKRENLTSNSLAN
jgi:hypothetical protein